MLIVLGVAAFILSKYGFSMAPLAVGICISSTIDQRFQQTIIAMRGNFMNITKYPIACVMLILCLFLLLAIVLVKPIRHLVSNSKED